MSVFPGTPRGAELVAQLEQAVNEGGDDLAPAALVIARVEYPELDPLPYLDRLDRLGREAGTRLARVDSGSIPQARVEALNEYLFAEEGFAGNREHYDDPRNSFLNEVLERRKGIPITLSVVYLEVARRAGLDVEGVNFPGHFLVRCPSLFGPDPTAEDLIIDPFHGGALLSEADCRQLLRQHLGDEAAFDRTLLAAATRRQIVVRMLVNLKRIYVRMRSFPQARLVSDLLVALDSASIGELRDRGLLAYHLQDFSAALRDLETYLQLTPRAEEDEESRSEYDQIWEHVKTLRRRVASFN
jgi:regulator of sirC expression with transglutaminase-like and TPR domain